MKRLFCIFAIALAPCLDAAAAASIVPAEPSSFDLVNLRMTVDGCVFNASSVRVFMHENPFTVTARRNQCLLPGPTEVVDIRLGTLPAGSYSVSVHDNPSDFAPPYERASFVVRDRPEIAIFPPPPRPLTDYSGLWYNPLESGWGLSIHQGAGDVVFAMLFVYGANSQPEWYSIQGGRWSSSTLWTGTVFRTTGPRLSDPVFDPSAVMYAGYGTVVLDFRQTPGSEGRARFDYTIDGVTASKSIRRIAL